MKNLAEDKDCDIEIKQELEIAKIPIHEFSFELRGEVPSKILGFLDGWKFERAWYYWVVTSEKNLLLFKYADPLHKKYGKAVRVDGHCGCPSPREWHSDPYYLGVSSYHVDSQLGLCKLVEAIKKQTEDNKKEK